MGMAKKILFNRGTSFQLLSRQFQIALG